MRTEQCLRKVNNKYIDSNEINILRPSNSNSWAVFLYYLSNELYQAGQEKTAEYVYYLNKIMHATDWFYAIDLPAYFWVEHPLGSVLGRASYEDYLVIYQGCTVGGNEKGSKVYYPKLGHHLMMYANSTILGDSKVGNWVVLSAGTYVKDETIPDNCIVFGSSPNIVIKEKKHSEMEDIFSAVWKGETK